MKMCVVCLKGELNVPSEWTSVLERTSFSQTQILFKLFDCLKEEFMTGDICEECFALVEEADELEFKLSCVQTLLKSRLQKDGKYFAPSRPSSREKDVENQHAPAKRKRSKEPGNALPTSDESTSSEFWQSVNSPALLATFLTSGRVDSDLTIATTQRGEDQLIYNGHVYRKKVYTPTMVDDHRGIFKWRCIRHHKKDSLCKGQIATSMDGLCVLLDSMTEHNHEPDKVVVSGILYRERLRTIALNHPKMKTSEILNNADMLMGPRVNLGVKDDKSLHRFIQRVRVKQSKMYSSDGSTHEQNRS